MVMHVCVTVCVEGRRERGVRGHGAAWPRRSQFEIQDIPIPYSNCNSKSTQAVRKLVESKKLENTLSYDSEFGEGKSK